MEFASKDNATATMGLQGNNARLLHVKIFAMREEFLINIISVNVIRVFSGKVAKMLR